MFRINLKQLFITLFLAYIPCGCENNSTSPIPEGHTDADGFILEDESGTEIYREFQGESTGSIAISVGEELELIVHFLDNEGNEIEHEGEEEDHDDELRITGHDEEIVTIESLGHDNHGDEEHCDDFLTEADCSMHSECEWHSDEGACEDGDHDDHDDEGHGGLILHITGISIGATNFKLELMHGDHADYTSTNNVPVTVE